MTPTTCFIILLSLYVPTYARIHPLIRAGVVSPDVVSKACEQSPDQALCVSVLKTQPNDVNDLKQAAMASIQAASGEAVSLSEMIKAARKREENKEVVEDGIEEETLADCAMSYINLVEILASASGGLSAGPGTDVNVKDKVTEAVDVVQTCEQSIAGGRKSPMVEEVAKKNENVRKLCSNALSVYNIYAGK